MQRAFATVDPGARYHHGWHVDAIAWQLERVARGETRRLIITLPPRSLKSIAASVAFPAWLLGHEPRRQIVAVSYSDILSEKLALDCIRVMEETWYQATFQGTRLARGRTRRADFATTKGGGRFSTTIGGTLTGRGGDILLIDDPHKPEDAVSEVKRTAVLDWFRSTLLSRQNDPQSSAIVLIQQRVHEGDLAGMLIEQGGWTHLDLPAIAEDRQVIDLGPRGRIVRTPGHLLHPDRLSQAVLDERRRDLGVRGIVPRDDKATRLLSVSHLIEGGQIAVPAHAPWIADLQREITLFPNGKHDDQVDSLTQFLRWMAEPKSRPRITLL